MNRENHISSIRPRSRAAYPLDGALRTLLSSCEWFKGGISSEATVTVSIAAPNQPPPPWVAPMILDTLRFIDACIRSSETGSWQAVER